MGSRRFTTSSRNIGATCGDYPSSPLFLVNGGYLRTGTRWARLGPPKSSSAPPGAAFRLKRRPRTPIGGVRSGSPALGANRVNGASAQARPSPARADVGGCRPCPALLWLGRPRNYLIRIRLSLLTPKRSHSWRGCSGWRGLRTPSLTESEKCLIQKVAGGVL